MPAAAAAAHTTPSKMRPPSSQDIKEGKTLPGTYKQRISSTPSSSSVVPAAKCPTSKRKHHTLYPGNITLTDELLYFLRKAPDKGVGTIAKIAQRQMRRAANCAEIMHAILYDIFLHPPADNYITPLLEQGKQNTSGITLHKHSMGVSPKFAFGTLLLMATAPNQGESPSRLSGHINICSNSIHKRLCQVAAEYDIATRSIALNFNFGHSYQHLAPAILAELKHIQSIPWPVIIDEPERQTQLHSSTAHHHCQQQQQKA